MKNGQFIVVEGVDCVGKTGLADFLSEQLNLRYLYGLQQPLAACRREIENLRDMNLRFFYYLAGIMCAQKELKGILAGGSGVVMDRYVYSTFMMHQALDVNTACVDMEKLPIIWPTCAILLTASEGVRATRRALRDGADVLDSHIEQAPGLLNKAQAAFVQWQKWNLVINTDNLTPAEIRAKVLRHLEE